MQDEEDREPRKAVAHRVGEALDTLSVEELGLRIALLEAEIARIAAARDVKTTALEQAGAIFRL